MRLLLAIVAALATTRCAHHYNADGMVMSIDAPRRTIVISHRDIAGYMPAMVMPFRVRHPSELSSLKPGSRVRFQLAVKKRSATISHVAASSSSNSNSPAPLLATKLSIGQSVPDFQLTDQQNLPVRFSSFRSKVVAINFIYTRCPLPDVCPRLCANFARLQKRFAGRDLVLLSISIDPQYDTPEVLAHYGKIWRADLADWHLLTGDSRAIQEIAAHFGMVYWPEEGAMTHNSQTAIVARGGRLAALVDGSAYAVSQLGDLIEEQLAR